MFINDVCLRNMCIWKRCWGDSLLLLNVDIDFRQHQCCKRLSLYRWCSAMQQFWIRWVSTCNELKIDNGERLKTNLYGKRHDLTFPIVNFSFISDNISAAIAYGVYISQRYSRTCSQYNDFLDIAQLAISVSILLYKQTNLVFVVFHCLFENLFFSICFVIRLLKY